MVNIEFVKNVRRLKGMSHTAVRLSFVSDKPLCSYAKGHHLQPFELGYVNIKAMLKFLHKKNQMDGHLKLNQTLLSIPE